MNPEILKEALREWAEEDSAQMTLAISLGLMTAETNYQTDAKHVFWSNHPIGIMLYDFLNRMVVLGILEKRTGEDLDQYRWNPSFKGSWELSVEERLKLPPDHC